MDDENKKALNDLGEELAKGLENVDFPAPDVDFPPPEISENDFNVAGIENDFDDHKPSKAEKNLIMLSRLLERVATTPRNKPEKERINFVVPKELAEMMKERCKAQGISLSGALKMLMEIYVGKRF